MFARYLSSEVIHDNWDVFEQAMVTGRDLFAQMISQAEKVKARGIHYGSVDDEELERLVRMGFDHHRLFYADQICGKMIGVRGCLESYINEMEHPQPDTEYTFYF